MCLTILGSSVVYGQHRLRAVVRIGFDSRPRTQQLTSAEFSVTLQVINLRKIPKVLHRRGFLLIIITCRKGSRNWLPFFSCRNNVL